MKMTDEQMQMLQMRTQQTALHAGEHLSVLLVASAKAKARGRAAQHRAPSNSNTVTHALMIMRRQQAVTQHYFNTSRTRLEPTLQPCAAALLLTI
eukprot:scaffold616_cov120-Isochrysis_galbana.AAC.2